MAESIDPHNTLTLANRPNHKHAVAMFFGFTTPLLLIALITYFMRIYSRIRPVFHLGMDDYMVSLGVVFAILGWTLQVIGIHLGAAQPLKKIDPANQAIVLKIAFACPILWAWSIAFVKISLALMLLRLRSDSPLWRWGMIGMTVILAVVATAQASLQITACIPIRGFWDRSIPGLQCRSFQTVQDIIYTFSAFYIATDIMFALLPITFIVRMRRPHFEKVVVAILMSFGLLATLAAVLKMAFLHTYTIALDPIRGKLMMSIWNYTEEYLGLFAACVPALKVPFERYLARMGYEIAYEGNIPRIHQKNSPGMGGSTPNVSKKGSGTSSKSLTRTSEEEGIILREMPTRSQPFDEFLFPGSLSDPEGSYCGRSRAGSLRQWPFDSAVITVGAELSPRKVHGLGEQKFTFS